jgi:hypothetical protein
MKYFLSLGCIIKDEDYLEEFLVYYRVLGVEHFFIYDNDSTIPIYKRLEKTKLKDFCTIIFCPGKAKQIPAYNHLIKYTKNLTEWLIVVDGDEFILPKKHKSLRDFLKEYKDYHAIGINWVMYGSSHHEKKQDGFIIDKYRKNSGVQGRHIKTICKPLYVKKIDIHCVIPVNPNKYIDPHKRIIKAIPFNEKYTIDIIQINHYWGKSMEDMLQKINRGRAPSDTKREIPTNYHEEDNSTICNLIADKYLNNIIKYFNNYNIKKK